VPHALLGVLLLLLWVPGLLGVLLLPLVLLGVLLGVLLLWMGTGLLLWVGAGLLLGMRALGLLGVGALGLVLLLGVLARLLGVPCCLLLLGVASRLLLGVLGLLVALGQLVLAPRVLPDQHLPHPLALALATGLLLHQVEPLSRCRHLARCPRPHHLDHLALPASPWGLADHDELALGPGARGHLHEPVPRGHRPR